MTNPAPTHDARRKAITSSAEKRSNGLAAKLQRAFGIARTTGRTLQRRSARAVAATRAGLEWTTRRVQAMPSSTSRSLAVGSVGLGAGLLIGGAPRLVAATGAAPAVVIGAAILLRPDAPVTTSEA